ncbi:type II toxin-antitoxin system Phd/YefM family antitoxin [Pelotomaculum isophthalicicum JI]|uniref:Type II toxin-antitoxin system Phd/YefM family antitoxin n=1 Tax=Pelotomaculum isophthalicicum JI TaxID=947010 RepID=A0A9X4H6E3_9FIRM|nr:hypothetical protein [Pelotomaculum isophthalicicum]MDF9408813.1 type II toxin-antitoxin system Phd/YefM family antitoxin [Pelotomaculum isophthalicicum JI]
MRAPKSYIHPPGFLTERPFKDCSRSFKGLSTDIQPATEFRANTPEILESLKKNRRTIILTQHEFLSY